MMITAGKLKPVALAFVWRRLYDGFLNRVVEPPVKSVGGELLAQSGAVEDCHRIMVDKCRSIDTTVFGMAQNKVDVLLLESGDEIILA